jgi:PAS domain S-box-containing protein
VTGFDQPDWNGPPAETLDELYENAPCGYLTTRADGVIVRANATLLRFLGESRDTLLGRPIQSILTTGARLFYETNCAPLLTLHGSLDEISLDLARADGGLLPALLNWRRVDDAQGRILGYRVMVVSAVERVAYERQLFAERERARQQEAMVRELNADLERRVEARTAELVQAKKMEGLGQLTGGIAHDFNNLLTPILITLDLLQRRYLQDERALRMTKSALSAAERARVLITRLLAFARRQHLHAQPVDLAALVRSKLDFITRSVGQSVAVSVSIADDLPPARVDRTQLEMALLNLCLNARDAMPQGGSLMLSGDEEMVQPEAASNLVAGRYVRLSVSDSGFGMDQETLLRAAEPFYSTKEVGKGTGLGLSMVHGLAAQSGGALVLESTRGYGTTATIWLPVDPSAAPIEEVFEPDPAAARRPLSVLLVDDDELVRFAASEMLHDLGHSAIQASCGAEAVEALRRHADFDLLITDYLMPGMTGVDLARVARKARPDLPVLLVTGYANIEDVDGGGLPRLAKPFGTHELSNAIAGILSRGLAPAR